MWYFVLNSVAAFQKAYKQAYDKFKEMFITPYETAFHNMFCDKIICIEEISLIKLSRTCIYNLSWVDKLYVFLGFQDIDYTNARLQKAMDLLRKAVNNSSNHSVYIVWYGNGVCVLTRGVPSLVPPPRPETNTPPLMMVLVNGVIDTTPFYRQTRGYVNSYLGLVPREYAVLSLLWMGEKDIHKLLDLLVGQNTFVSVVDGNTFEEKVFKDGDTVVL